MARWTPAAYGALVIVATVNREVTAVLLVASWLALRPRAWRWGLLFAVLALVTHLQIRLAMGSHPNDYTLAHVWWLNTHSAGLLHKALTYNVLLLPLWLAGRSAWSRADARLHRLTWAVVGVYLPALLLLAVWQETRLLMPLVILVLPMVTRLESPQSM